MDMNTTIFWQEEIEKKFSRKHIDGYIRNAILGNPDMVAKINQGVELLEEYRSKEYDYESKNVRVRQLNQIDLKQLVLDVFVGVAYCLREEMFTSVTAQMAGRLKFDDKTDAIKTIAEIMAVLCLTDAYDITKAGRMASLMVVSNIPLEDELVEFIENSQYLPPMVCPPKELVNNFSSGYLTHNDSLILGSGNHHDGDLCLDALNIINSVPLRLATDFISKVEETPTFELDTPEKIEQWKIFKAQGYRFYRLLAGATNRFYLTHKVDKRGRIYASGYHISTQSTPHKKAMIEFDHQELIEVPDQYKL